MFAAIIEKKIYLAALVNKIAYSTLKCNCETFTASACDIANFLVYIE